MKNSKNLIQNICNTIQELSNQNQKHIESFKSELGKHGLYPESIVISDGKIVRFDVDKRGDKAGWYSFSKINDDFFVAIYGNWKTGLSEKWSSINKMNKHESYKFHKAILQCQKAHQLTENIIWDEAKQKAISLIHKSQVAVSHPYLERKKIPSCGVTQIENDLIIPVHDINNDVWSFQKIAPDGKKRFLSRGKKKGNFYRIAGHEPTFIGEGYATMAAVHLATGCEAIVAFDAGNLIHVCEEIHKHHPKKQIIITADNDRFTENNPGVFHAKKASKQIKCNVIIPEFGDIVEGTDFNDLYIFKGIDEVRRQLFQDTPLPLLRPLIEPPRFPLDDLPDVLKNTIISLHKNIQSPISLCAQSILAAVSLATQGHANVNINGRIIPISENFITIAESGERKSSTNNQVLSSFENHQLKLKKQYSTESKDYKIKVEAWNKSKEQALKQGKNYQERENLLIELGPEPIPPLGYLILIEDFTFQGILKYFRNGRPSIGIFSDEGGRFIGGYAMKEDNKTQMLAAMNNLWDGKPISRSTAGEGTDLHNGKRVSTHLMVQPNVANSLLNDSMARDIGFLARSLITKTESMIGTRNHSDTDLSNDQHLKNFHYRIQEILETPLTIMEGSINDLSLRDITLSEASKELYYQFMNQLESRMDKGKDLEEIRNFGSKAGEHAVRLAGAISLFENCHTHEISESYMKIGIKLAEFYISEHKRLCMAATEDNDLENAKKLLDWIYEKWITEHGQFIDLASVYTLGPNVIRSAKKARKVINILENHGYLVKIKDGKIINGKKRKYVWSCIPKSNFIK